MNSAKHQIYLSLKIFLGYYRNTPLQAGSILLGIALAVSLFIGIKVTNENAIASYQQQTQLFNAQISASIVPADGFKYLSEDQYFTLRQQGINALAVLTGSAYDQHNNELAIQSVDLVAAYTMAKAQAKSNFLTNGELPLGRLLSASPLVIMTQSNQQVYAPTGKLTLNGQTFEVITLTDNSRLGSAVLMDLSLGQQVLEQQQLSYIALFSDVNGLKQQLEQHNLLLDGNQLQKNDDGTELTQLTESFHLNLQAISMLAYLVGLFIAYNGVRYSLIKRQKLLVKLLQLGISRKSLMAALLIELMFMVQLGTLLGFIVGMQLSHWLQPMIQITLEQLYLVNFIAGEWQLIWLIEALALTLAVSLFACVPLYRNLVKQNLSQNLTLVGRQHFDSHYPKWQFVLGILGISISAFVISTQAKFQLTMPFTGLLVLSATLLLPQLLNTFIRLLSLWIKHPISHYMVADARELISPLSLAMMALFIALSSNVAMNTLTTSFNHTLMGWLDVVLDGDLYVRPNHQNLQQIDQVLSQDPNVVRVNHQWETQSRYINEQGLAQTISLLARDNLVAVESTMFKDFSLSHIKTFINGQSVFISEPMAIKNQLNIGDEIFISALKDDFPHGITISAIYFDYGNPYGEVMISEKLWYQSTLPASARNIAVIYQGDITMLEKDLLTKTNLSAVNLYRPNEIKNTAIKGLNRTFAITGVMNSLTLVVAAIGLFSAYMMITQSRESTIARLHALGMTKPQLLLLIISQMLLLVVLVLIFALPFGALMGWILTYKTILDSFGWTLATVWPWGLFFKSALVAILAAMMALLFPLIKLARTPVISSLQREIQ